MVDLNDLHGLKKVVLVPGNPYDTTTVDGKGWAVKMWMKEGVLVLEKDGTAA